MAQLNAVATAQQWRPLHSRYNMQYGFFLGPMEYYCCSTSNDQWEKSVHGILPIRYPVLPIRLCPCSFNSTWSSPSGLLPPLYCVSRTDKLMDSPERKGKKKMMMTGRCCAE